MVGGGNLESSARCCSRSTATAVAAALATSSRRSATSLASAATVCAYRTAFCGRSREGIDAMLDLHPRRTRIFDKAPLREPSLVLNHKRAFEIDALASA